jgi:hypothetical protein
METLVRTEDGWLRFDAPTLEVARLLASVYGWDVDCEPGAPGKVQLTAKRGDATIRTNGTTVYDAAEKLIGKLAPWKSSETESG